MEVQPQLILLQKTLVQIEGLGRILYPDLDIWKTGKPVLKAWMIEQTGPTATLRRLRREWPDLRYALEKLPLVARRLVDDTLERPAGPPPTTSSGPAGGQAGSPGGSYRATAGGALVIAGAVWLGLDTPPLWVGWLLGATGLLTLWFGKPKV